VNYIAGNKFMQIPLEASLEGSFEAILKMIYMGKARIDDLKPKNIHSTANITTNKSQSFQNPEYYLVIILQNTGFENYLSHYSPRRHSSSDARHR
jgi:hypothetical protein